MMEGNSFALFTLRVFFVVATVIMTTPVPAAPQDLDNDSGSLPVSTGLPFGAIPKLVDADTKLPVVKTKEHNFVAVPIPMSGPTFGTGLIVGGAYFYPQGAEQKNSQPASFTGAAAGYTSNSSWFAGVMQQNYFKKDTWRFNVLAGYLDFRLELMPSAEGSAEGALDWLVRGGILQTSLSRRIGGHWFLGVMARYLDIEQDFDLNIDLPEFSLGLEIRSPAVGLTLEFDTRDKPSNAFKGRHLQLKAIFSDQQQLNDGAYQSYYARFRSYHQLKDSLILAWDVSGCTKSGRIPLWDTCRLPLRGFPGTEYLSKKSLYGQAEVRWNFYKRWGAVGFVGAGRVVDSLAHHGEDETIPSYGVGLRFMVLKSQRINMRVDYARSNNGNSALYLGVIEAF